MRQFTRNPVCGTSLALIGLIGLIRHPVHLGFISPS
jgi:hypothetical protein